MGKWVAGDAILGDGGPRRRSMLGWEEAEVSIGPVEFKVPLGYPWGGMLPALDSGQWIQRAALHQREGCLGVAAVSPGVSGGRKLTALDG